MQDGLIDYSAFTERELREAHYSIDERKYPLNYARLTAEFERRKVALTGEWPAPPAPEPPAEPAPRKGPYVPNHIPADVRLQYLVLSLLLVAYGAYGVYADDLYIPERRGPGHHFHGDAALYAYGAILCSVAAMLVVVADHYDERENEEMYQAIGAILYGVAFILYIAAHVARA